MGKNSAVEPGRGKFMKNKNKLEKKCPVKYKDKRFLFSIYLLLWTGIINTKLYKSMFII